MTSRWTALRHHDFRLLWLGLLAAYTGVQMQVTAVNWQLFNLLRGQETALDLFGFHLTLGASALGLGTLGLARMIPIIGFALVGGALADTADRRKLVLLSQALTMGVLLLLSVLTLTGRISTPMIYLLTAASSAASAFGNPARQSMLPNLVPKEDFTNAVSLNSLIMQLTQVLGPALAGLLLTLLPVGWIYGIGALGFFGTLIALTRMHFRDTERTGKPQVKLSAIGAGFRFVFGQRLLRSTMLLDFWATFFSSARTMLPIVAAEVLRTDARGYGLLATAESLGAVVTGLFITTRREIHRQGLALLGGVALYGAATALFGISTSFALSYVFYALVGAGDTVSTVIRNIIRQTVTPDNMRGRMMGVNQLFFQGGPQLGELEAGLVASAFGVPAAIVSGGICTLLIAGWVAWRYPDLRARRAE